MTIRNITKYLEHEDLLEYPNQVFSLELSREEAREILDGGEVESFDSALDEAQGQALVHPVYLIIKISK